MESIFIQIASYRDPELIPTIKNLLTRATHPERLKICIAHQFSKEDLWDTLSEFEGDSRFIVIEIPYAESQGACWARFQIQQHYNNEDYTLQLDSHHRFVPGWDTECIAMLKELQKKGSPKPLITSYLPSYVPSEHPSDNNPMPATFLNKPVYGMALNEWMDGVALFHPYTAPTSKEPVKSRFYSGHFAFTVGSFAKEVMHDPMMYFHGEEISLSVRAYTHGYDLYMPHKTLAWHEYTRQGRTKHWSDHDKWIDIDIASKSRVRQLLGVNGEVCTPCNKNTFKNFDVGLERSIKDYEVYAGVDFKTQKTTVKCQQNLSPPGNSWEIYINKRNDYKVTLHKADFEEIDYSFAVLLFEDNKGEIVYQDYITKKEIESLVNGNNSYLILNKISTCDTPHRYVVWPYSKSRSWGIKLITYF